MSTLASLVFSAIIIRERRGRDVENEPRIWSIAPSLSDVTGCHGGLCSISEMPSLVTWTPVVAQMWWWLSPPVFGNGRTHSGGLEGSGGSRLANNWSRAFTHPFPLFLGSLKISCLDMKGCYYNHQSMCVCVCEWLQAVQWGVKTDHSPWAYLQSQNTKETGWGLNKCSTSKRNNKQRNKLITEQIKNSSYSVGSENIFADCRFSPQFLSSHSSLRVMLATLSWSWHQTLRVTLDLKHWRYGPMETFDSWVITH